MSYIPLSPPLAQDLRSGGFFYRVRPPNQPHTLAMARLTLLRNVDARARVEDPSISEKRQGLFERFMQYFNGNHRRQCVEHYCHQDPWV